MSSRLYANNEPRRRGLAVLGTGLLHRLGWTGYLAALLHCLGRRLASRCRRLAHQVTGLGRWHLATGGCRWTASWSRRRVRERVEPSPRRIRKRSGRRRRSGADHATCSRPSPPSGPSARPCRPLPRGPAWCGRPCRGVSVFDWPGQSAASPQQNFLQLSPAVRVHALPSGYITHSTGLALTNALERLRGQLVRPL
jgi:hypothetical protein